MTTIDPNFAIPDCALPVGADAGYTDSWQPPYKSDPAYRCVWSRAFDDVNDIRTVVVQYADGTIATESNNAPMVFLGGNGFHPDEARVMAGALLAAADLADQWSGVKRR